MKPQQFVTNTMEESFQFAAFTEWYEEKFGGSLALLPLPESKDDQVITLILSCLRQAEYLRALKRTGRV